MSAATNLVNIASLSGEVINANTNVSTTRTPTAIIVDNARI